MQKGKLMSERSSLSRRKVLKTTGLSVTAACGFSSVTSADSNTRTEESDAPEVTVKRTVVESTESYELVKMWKQDSQGNTVGNKFLYKIDTADKTVSVVDQADASETLNKKIGFTTQDHTQFIDSYDGAWSEIGNCGGYAFDNHYEAGVAIRTGEALENHEGQIAMGVGAIAGSAIGTRAGGAGTVIGTAIGVVAGIIIDAAFLSHYDLSGRTMTFLFRDYHSSVEEFEMGAITRYDAGASVDESFFTTIHPGHLGAGEDLSNYV